MNFKNLSIFIVFASITLACNKEPIIDTDDEPDIIEMEDKEEIIHNYFPLQIGNSWTYNSAHYSHWFNDYDGSNNPGGHPIGPVEDTTHSMNHLEMSNDTIINEKTYLHGFKSKLLRKENAQTWLYYYNDVTKTHHEFQLMHDADTVGTLWVSDTLNYTYNNEKANVWFEAEYIEHFDSLTVDNLQFYDVKRVKYFIGVNTDDVPSYANLCSNFNDLYFAQDIGPVYWKVKYCLEHTFNIYSESSSYSLIDYTIN